MKVLLINYGPKPLPPTRGGGVETLIEYFYKHASENIDLSIASYYDKEAFKHSKEYSKINFIYIHRTLAFKVNQIFRYFINKHSLINYGNAFIVKLCKTVDLNNYDVIISENGIYMGKYLRKFYNGKLVLHLHNNFLNTFTKSGDLIKSSYDQIWTLSKFVKDRVDSINGLKLTKLLYNGVDTDLFSFNNFNKLKDITRSKYGISRDDIVFMFTGRIVEEKGIKQLINTFNNINKQFTNTFLFIIGDCNIENSYVNLLKSIVTKNIKFTGFVSHNSIPEIMSIADFGIAPTIHLEKYFDENNNYLGIIEGFNLSIIEFMSLGIPMIVTNSGGMPELITNETGIIIDCNEDRIENELEYAMLKVINGDIKFNNENIANHAFRFSMEKYVNKFEEYLMAIYEN